jgi:energy-coupling factor transporter ATP-binding protein EcfA2
VWRLRAPQNTPHVVLADEPTGNSTRLREPRSSTSHVLSGAGRTVIVVTHDTDVARRAHRIICMKDGRLAANVDGSRRVSASPRQQAPPENELRVGRASIPIYYACAGCARMASVAGDLGLVTGPHGPNAREGDVAWFRTDNRDSFDSHVSTSSDTASVLISRCCCGLVCGQR